MRSDSECLLVDRQVTKTRDEKSAPNDESFGAIPGNESILNHTRTLEWNDECTTTIVGPGNKRYKHENR